MKPASVISCLWVASAASSHLRNSAPVIEVVLKLEFPDDPGAVLGRHTMVRNAGPDWGRMSAFDQRREELNDRNRCPDDKLIEVLCALHR